MNVTRRLQALVTIGTSFNYRYAIRYLVTLIDKMFADLWWYRQVVNTVPVSKGLTLVSWERHFYYVLLSSLNKCAVIGMPTAAALRRLLNHD